MFENERLLKKYIRLMSGACVIFILIIILRIMFPAGEYGTVQTTALLNTSYSGRINAVEIKAPAEHTEIRFEKIQGSWRAVRTEKNQTVYFPADEEKIFQLLQYLQDKRAVRTASDSSGAWQSFGLDEKTAVRVTAGSIGDVSAVRRKNDLLEIFTDLFFGFHDTAGTSVYMRTNKQLSTYAVSAAVSHYLTTSASFWAESRIIGSKYEKQFSLESLQRITVIKNGKAFRTLTPADQDFYKRSRDILSSSSSSVSFTDPHKNSDFPSWTILLENGAAHSLTINIIISPLDNALYCTVEDAIFSYAKNISKSTFTLLTGEILE